MVRAFGTENETADSVCCRPFEVRAKLRRRLPVSAAVRAAAVRGTTCGAATCRETTACCGAAPCIASTACVAAAERAANWAAPDVTRATGEARTAGETRTSVEATAVVAAAAIVTVEPRAGTDEDAA